MGEVEKLAKELSTLVPTYLQHMYPFVFKEIDVSPSQMLAILSIGQKKICTLSELSKQLKVSAPTVTGIIDRLEKSGFVKRIPDKKDRRVTNITLTLKGKGILILFYGNIKKRWHHILLKLPLSESRSIVNIIRKITKGFEDGTI